MFLKYFFLKEKPGQLIDNEIVNIYENYSIDKEEISKNKINSIKISLVEENVITNMSYMFSDCLSLSSQSDLSKWNTYNVTDMSYIFHNCLTLTDLPDISKCNISIVISI